MPHTLLVRDYLLALGRDPTLAVISQQNAADALGMKRSAVSRLLKIGKLEPITVGKTKCVRASSVVSIIEIEENACETIQNHLETLAKKNITTVYGDIMPLVGLNWRIPKDRATIGKYLGIISRRSYVFGNSKILISALVFNKNLGKPSDSFFLLAKSLGENACDQNKYLKKQLAMIWHRYSEQH